MKWQDEAIVLSVQKYGESSGIVSMLTHSHGMHKGLVRSVLSKNNRGIYLTGNKVTADWNARLPEHLGNFKAEIIKANGCIIMNDYAKLTALSSICQLLNATLAEREPTFIYDDLVIFIEKLCDDENWQIDYILLELKLLSNLGFRLSLDECVATGVTDGLKYISPKSGCAVSDVAGEPYKDKLFKLPEFLNGDFIDHENYEQKSSDIKEGSKMTLHFLQKYIFQQNNIKLPEIRKNLQEIFN